MSRRGRCRCFERQGAKVHFHARLHLCDLDILHCDGRFPCLQRKAVEQRRLEVQIVRGRKVRVDKDWTRLSRTHRATGDDGTTEPWINRVNTAISNPIIFEVKCALKFREEFKCYRCLRGGIDNVVVRVHSNRRTAQPGKGRLISFCRQDCVVVEIKILAISACGSRVASIVQDLSVAFPVKLNENVSVNIISSIARIRGKSTAVDKVELTVATFDEVVFHDGTCRTIF